METTPVRDFGRLPPLAPLAPAAPSALHLHASLAGVDGVLGPHRHPAWTAPPWALRVHGCRDPTHHGAPRPPAAALAPLTALSGSAPG